MTSFRVVSRFRHLLRLVVVLALSAVFLVVAVEAGTSDSGEGAVIATAKSQRLMSLGMEFSCAVSDAGTVQCWGNNGNGQLGTGDLLTSTSPRLASGVSSVVELAAGDSHTCALIHGGTVKCWGLDGSGQIGNGLPLADVTLAETVPGLSGVTSLAAGGFHTCALVTGGTVKCWGQDGSGQLGDGSLGDFASAPQAVTGLPAGDPVVALSGGESHTCAVTEAGNLWCWGHNGFGQLGNNSTTTSAVPVEVGEPGDPGTPMSDVLAVSAGGGHTCAILDRPNRPTYCWGANAFGQLGHETPKVDDVMSPSKVPLLVQVDANPAPNATDPQPMTLATAVSAGMEHTCAVIGAAGSVRCWGHNGASQLGFDQPTLPDDKHPTDSTYAGLVPGLSASAVVAGGFHTCAFSGGATRCWGYNFFGQLGGYDAQVEEPTTVTAVRGVAQVAVGTHAACVLVSDVPGGLALPYCWGSNANGRLGIDSTTPPSTTVRRPVTAGFPTSATDIRAGNGTFCAVPAAADRRCWGLNGSGEVGDGTQADRHAPVVSTHLAGATKYDLGGTLSGGPERGTVCKVVSGQAQCYGYNGQGQLGDGTTTSSLSPVVVKWDNDPDEDEVNLVPLTGVTDVAVGGDHACAIVGGGQVWCWGANNLGQLGDNTTDARVGAVKVQKDDDPDDDDPLTGATIVAAGNSHTCALVGGGKVHCWGATGSGQLGRSGAGQHANEPVNLDGTSDDLERATDLVAGDNHSCVVQAGEDDPDNQTMLCWGANNENQLGVSGGNSNAAKVVLETPDPDDGELPGPWILDVGASRDNTCAVLLDTTVSCWGDNTDGQVGDGIGTTSMALVTVQAAGSTYNTNEIPQPQALSAQTSPGVFVDIDVPLNVDPPANGLVTLVSVGDPPLGTAALLDTDTIRYTPDAGCHDDTFAYVVSDGIAQVAAQVTVTMNCPPVALPDTATTQEDTTVDIAVLGNDSDEDGDPLTIDPTFPVGPAHGSVSVVAGKVRYAPAADFCGPPTDTFTYRISDGHGHQATASVVVTVTCGQDGPSAANDNVSTPEDTLLELDDELLGNDGDVDGDTLTFTSVGAASHGTTSTNGAVVRYQPAPDYCGPDSFTYQVSDGTANATATVNVSVLCAGDSPKANPDSGTVAEDGNVLVNVKANDTDPDGDALTVSAPSSPAHGAAVLEAGGIRYTPAADYCGQDSFTYVVSDGALSAVGTVTVTVTCTNDTPVANADAATTNEDVTVHVHVLTNDTDADDNPLHVGAISDPAHGTAVLAGGNAVAYTPDPNFNGTDSFTYEAVDPTGASSTATVTVTVTPVDDPVQLAAIADKTTAWGDAVAVPLSASDLDAEPIIFSVVTGPSGTAVNGSAFEWTPTAAQVGVHTVKVRASSGGANSDRTFTVTVTKRATLLLYDGSVSGQVSDSTPVHATLRDAVTNAPVAGRGVGFVLGSTSATGTTDAAGGASALMQVIGAPGVRTLASSFAGDAAWKSSTASSSFTVSKEGFTVALGGTQLVTTASAAATVTYTADLAEEADGTFAGTLSGSSVAFKRVDGATICTATASATVPGQARATCTATQPVGALPVVVTATSATYSGLSAVGVVTVANTGSGLTSGAGRVQGDAFGYQVKPGTKKVAPVGQVVHVVVSGGTAHVVSASTITSVTTSCAGNPKVCKATVQAASATVTSVNLTTGEPTAASAASLVIDATAPNKYAVSVTGSVTRTIGTPAAQVVIDGGAILVGS